MKREKREKKRRGRKRREREREERGEERREEARGEKEERERDRETETLCGHLFPFAFYSCGCMVRLHEILPALSKGWGREEGQAVMSQAALHMVITTKD